MNDVLRELESGKLAWSKLYPMIDKLEPTPGEERKLIKAAANSRYWATFHRTYLIYTIDKPEHARMLGL